LSLSSTGEPDWLRMAHDEHSSEVGDHSYVAARALAVLIHQLS
jgi:hypothetical protein